MVGVSVKNVTILQETLCGQEYISDMLLPPTMYNKRQRNSDLMPATYPHANTYTHLHSYILKCIL